MTVFNAIKNCLLVVASTQAHSQNSIISRRAFAKHCFFAATFRRTFSVAACGNTASDCAQRWCGMAATAVWMRVNSWRKVAVSVSSCALSRRPVRCHVRFRVLNFDVLSFILERCVFLNFLLPYSSNFKLFFKSVHKISMLSFRWWSGEFVRV